jgi:hypothetical protein
VPLGALDVGVLDAQQHRAAVVAGVEEVEDRGARAADVEKAGRRRGETEFHAAWSLTNEDCGLRTED